MGSARSRLGPTIPADQRYGDSPIPSKWKPGWCYRLSDFRFTRCSRMSFDWYVDRADRTSVWLRCYAPCAVAATSTGHCERASRSRAGKLLPCSRDRLIQAVELLASALLAGAVACVAGGFLFCGGVLLAAATVKPQLAWPLVAWLIIWTLSDWRNRRRFLFGFGLTMALLLGGAEIILPGWWRLFANALGQYHRYTQNQSVLLVPWEYIRGSLYRGCRGRLR